VRVPYLKAAECRVCAGSIQGRDKHGWLKCHYGPGARPNAHKEYRLTAESAKILTLAPALLAELHREVLGEANGTPARTRL